VGSKEATEMSFEKVFPTAKTTPLTDEFDITTTLGEYVQYNN